MTRRCSRRARALAVLLGLTGATACVRSEPTGSVHAAPPVSTGPVAATSSTAAVAATSSTAAVAATSSTAEVAASSPTGPTRSTGAGAGGAAPVAFAASVRPIDDALAVRLRTSWRPGCPVPLSALRYVTLRHWGTDGEVREGELVVHAEHADAMVSVFAELFAARFPIERMRLVDDYGGDDQASMRANNTSAFNCREVAGRPGVLSNHAWGTAIDINPLVNPWVSGSRVDPPEGAPYADRSSLAAGGIAPGDAVTRAFARIGWGWGGDWPDSKDWQHFSASGR